MFTLMLGMSPLTYEKGIDESSINFTLSNLGTLTVLKLQISLASKYFAIIGYTTTNSPECDPYNQ
jgi:hypothetical protein